MNTVPGPLVERDFQWNQRVVTKKYSAFFNITILFAAGLIMYSAPASAGKCGRGCQQSMDGACTMEPRLWRAAIESRFTLTSCCRSPQYNAQLRSCGYFPSSRSAHMTGQAVDIKISPKNCNARYLQGIGFPPVCPHYHHGHCHVQTRCGNAQTASRARERVRHQRAPAIRSQSRARISSGRTRGRSSKVSTKTRRSAPRSNYRSISEIPWYEKIFSEIAR